MFSPNCVVVVPSPEISIKSSIVRGYMLKKLQENMSRILAHEKVTHEAFVTLSLRIIIKSAFPKKALEALIHCFGINHLALAQEVSFVSLDELCLAGVELSKEKISNGTFAVRGKSFVKDFSSREFEVALGSALIKSSPALKVNLSSPQKELYCIVHNKKAFFYFEQMQGAFGMPLGSQGKAGLLISESVTEKEYSKLARNIIKVGCSLVLVLENGKAPLLAELAPSNVFVPFKVISVKEAKESYKSGKISAFFSAAKTQKEAGEHSELLGAKVFAPLILEL